MEQKVSKAKAKELFEAGRTIFVKPALAENPDLFCHLEFRKSKYTPQFPENKIAYYEKNHAPRFGKGVTFLVKPLPVHAQWTGNGYRLKAEGDSHEFRVHGREGKLVQFVKSRLLIITNSGIFTPVWRGKLENA